MGETTADRGAEAGAADRGLTLRPVDLPPEATFDVPALGAANFRALGACEIGPAGGRTVPTQVYCARYGDAYAFADPLDSDVLLRVVSALASGRIVETRVIAEGPADKSVFDRLVAAADHAVLAARYPDRPGLGVRRQIVAIEDLASLWVTHRGFLRRVQGTGDEVVDHSAFPVFEGMMVRAWTVRRVVDQPELRLVTQAAMHLRNAALALPAILALSTGLAWWSAGLLTGVPAIAAVLARDAVRNPEWRPWLLLLPLGGALFGGLTIGISPVLTMLAFDVLVVAASETLFPTWGTTAHRLIFGEPVQPGPYPFVEP